VPENLGAIGSFLPLILLFVIFYFMLIRPQQKQQRKRQDLLKSLKKGDRVVTIGGMYGVIKEINENVLTVRIADNVNVKLLRGGVDRVLDDAEE
jgi:preprotein translocase subunit YajC